MKRLHMVTVVGLAAAMPLLVLLMFAAGTVLAQEAPQGPACDATGKEAILLVCDYAGAARTAAHSADDSRIELNHSRISFETDDENYMQIELTFTNRGKAPFSEARPVYLAIDNEESGENYFRRILAGVDFRRLAPGKQLKFSEQLLVSSLRPGRYRVRLWIPQPDPSLQFNPAQNILLSNLRASDPATRLNELATFTLER